jgi:hypothetical protein
MNRFHLLLLLCCSFACRHASSPQLEKEWQSWLDQKEYFKLRSSLELHKYGVDPEKALYFRAFIDNVFNMNVESIQDIRALIEGYGDHLPDSVKARLKLLEEDNYFKTFQYAMAARVDNELIDHYKKAMDSAAYADVRNTALITNGLAGVPLQEAQIPGNVVLPWTKNKVGLMEIPVRHGDSTYLAIFDTRANISSVSATYAKKLGIRMLNVSYDEGAGVTGQRFKCSLGVADSLRINEILMKNVVFQVMPDEVLYIAPIDLSLNIIIGYPVIAQWREIRIHQNGTMTIPAKPGHADWHNLAMDGLDPVICAIAGPDTLGFKFDTGASSSDLFDNYFRRYRQDILKKGKASTIRLGGAGGVVEKDVYMIRDFSIRVGSKTATLKQVAVHKDPIPNLNEKYYGNLGQDLIGQFSEMILNFESMFIDFK